MDHLRISKIFFKNFGTTLTFFSSKNKLVAFSYCNKLNHIFSGSLKMFGVNKFFCYELDKGGRIIGWYVEDDFEKENKLMKNFF